MILYVVRVDLPFVDLDSNGDDDVKKETEDFQNCVSPNAFVDKVGIEIRICSGTNPDIWKIFARQNVENELKGKGKNECPTVDEKAPEFVVETSRIFDPENAEVVSAGKAKGGAIKVSILIHLI